MENTKEGKCEKELREVVEKIKGILGYKRGKGGGKIWDIPQDDVPNVKYWERV